MNRRVPFAWTWIVAVCLGVPAVRTGRTQAVQFDASRAATLMLDASSAVIEWTAVGGGASLAPVHFPSNGWSLAVATDGPDGRSVDFAAPGVASPLHASGSAETVAYVFAVVRCQAPSDLATLLDAPSPFRAGRRGSQRPAVLRRPQVGRSRDRVRRGAVNSLLALGVSPGHLFTTLIKVR